MIRRRAVAIQPGSTRCMTLEPGSAPPEQRHLVAEASGPLLMVTGALRPPQSSAWTTPRAAGDRKRAAAGDAGDGTHQVTRRSLDPVVGDACPAPEVIA